MTLPNTNKNRKRSCQEKTDSDNDSDSRLTTIRNKLTSIGISPSSPNNSDTNIDLISTINLLVNLVIKQSEQITTLQTTITNIEKKLQIENPLLSSEDKEKARSIVIVGLSESQGKNDRENFIDDTNKINKIIDSLGIPTNPITTYRMGKPRNDGKGRPIKVVMPTTYHQRLILSRSKSLRNISDFSGVYLRPSMTKEERQHDYELRKECRDKNSKLNVGEPPWKIFKGKIVRAFNQVSLNK